MKLIQFSKHIVKINFRAGLLIFIFVAACKDKPSNRFFWNLNSDNFKYLNDEKTRFLSGFDLDETSTFINGSPYYKITRTQSRLIPFNGFVTLKDSIIYFKLNEDSKDQILFNLIADQGHSWIVEVSQDENFRVALLDRRFSSNFKKELWLYEVIPINQSGQISSSLEKLFFNVNIDCLCSVIYTSSSELEELSLIEIP